MALNYSIVTDRISTYVHSEEPRKEVMFLKSESIPQNVVRISVIPGQINNVMEYNISEHQKITALSDNLHPICENYLFAGKFTQPVSKDYGKWVSYNSEDQCFYIRFDYVFLTQNDYSSAPTCSYLTLPNSSLSSSHYQYANKSKGSICSNPIVIQANEGKISYCSMILEHPCSCGLYSKDSKLISSYLVSFKFSEKQIKFSSYITRYIDKISVSIINETNNNEPVLSVCLENLNNCTTEDLYRESDLLMQEVLSSYSLDTHEISQVFSSSEQTVSISKKSYIASLV